MMNLKKRTSVLFIGIITLYSFSLAQRNRVIYDDEAPKGEYSVCAWERVNLLSNPGESANVVASIHFAEEVMHLGREAFVRGRENNNYIWVESTMEEQGGSTIGILLPEEAMLSY